MTNITTQIDDGICTVKINRPQKLNAMNIDVAKEIISTFKQLEKDDNVKVIILTGEGDKAFSAGADIEYMSKISPEESERYAKLGQELTATVENIRKPTIAMINGPAVGSGMDMALQCDIRIGCENTRFVGYHQVGQIFENGGSYYLPKMAGLGRALEFAYTGHLDAERAYSWGVLNHLVPSEELEEKTKSLCDAILAIPPLVQWTSKRIMRAAVDSSLETSMVLTSNASDILSSSNDAQEARQAFIEKRVPDFTGK